jgi:transposase
MRPCALKSKCTPSKERRVKRWEHEVLDTMRERLDRAPQSMRIRRQTAEHPFGTSLGDASWRHPFRLFG